jgi:hypothetical protein
MFSKFRWSEVRQILKMGAALAPLSLLGTLALWGCAPSAEEEESAPPPSSASVALTEAELEALPLAHFVQQRGYPLYEVIDGPPLHERLQRLLGSSLPRLLKNAYEIKADGGMVTALPSAQETNWCGASVFWADVRADRIQVWIPRWHGAEGL